MSVDRGQAGMSAQDFKLVTSVFKGLVVAPIAACGAGFVIFKLWSR